MIKKEIFEYENAIEMLDLMIAVADNNLVFADAVITDSGEWDPKKWDKLKREARKFLSEERRKRLDNAMALLKN